MTMSFQKPRPDAFADIKAGQEIHFSFKESNGDYVLDSVDAVHGGH